MKIVSHVLSLSPEISFGSKPVCRRSVGSRRRKSVISCSHLFADRVSAPPAPRGHPSVSNCQRRSDGLPSFSPGTLWVGLHRGRRRGILRVPRRSSVLSPRIAVWPGGASPRAAFFIRLARAEIKPHLVQRPTPAQPVRPALRNQDRTADISRNVYMSSALPGWAPWGQLH